MLLASFFFFLLQFLILFLYVCNKFTYTTSLRRPILKTQTSSHQLGQESIFNNILYPNIYDDYNIKTIIMVKWVCYLTHTSSQKVRRTGRNWMGLETRSQMTNHCNGHASHLKTAPSLSPSVCLSLSSPCSFLSQSSLCNCLKMHMKFSLEEAERVKSSDCQR